MLSPHEIDSFIKTDNYLGLKKIMSYSAINAMTDMFKGDTKEWDNKELDIFNAIKFF
jgi:hypothetical protein